MKLGHLAIIAAAMTCSAATAYAGNAPMVTTPSQIKWGPAPNMLPPGAQMAVMTGDPASKGFVSFRLRLPAGYAIKPHFHPTDEHVTVLLGTMHFGMGDEMDAAAEKSAGPGGYFMVKAEAHHYAVAQTAAEVQIDLNGPFELTYVNPADDPRKTN
jgi:quercetin dioxygenase-like cupin family protein